MRMTSMKRRNPGRSIVAGAGLLALGLFSISTIGRSVLYASILSQTGMRQGCATYVLLI